MKGHKYYLRNWRITGLTIWAGLMVSLFSIPTYGGQPRNDELRNPTAIRSLPFSELVDTTTATSNPRDPFLSCNDGGGHTDGNTVWYSWKPMKDATVNISTVGSTDRNGNPLDTAIGAFTRVQGKLTEIACVDKNGLADEFSFKGFAGDTYYLKFGEHLNGAGGGKLIVAVDHMPQRAPLVLESIHNGLSEPIRDMVSSAIPGKSSVKKPVPFVLQVFDGADNDDNKSQNGYMVAPPDTNGDVGPSHYVQMTNMVTTIFDKSGNRILGPFPNNVFWTGQGGLCEVTNEGDPIVLYDEETDRWLVSQFAYNDAFTAFSLCVAVSQTADPAGKYFQHQFDFSGIGFPDYPKYGFVTGAIGVMINLFGETSFLGTMLGAIDKTEIFNAGPATMVLFNLGEDLYGFVAGDNDGPVFDNMPPTFAAKAVANSGGTIDFWEIAPNFPVPVYSTVNQVARIPVPHYDSELCKESRDQCINQPDGAPALEALSDRLMHRLQLRNFGREKRAVVNHTVDVDDTGRAGIRWYEFANYNDSGWKLKSSQTFSPDQDHRWMGSIAMNVRGDLCLGYSISSATTYPGIGVSGRLGHYGSLNIPEIIAFDGNIDRHVQRDVSRWGDYSAMAIDPVDDTCWYTQEYAKPNITYGEKFGWATKVMQLDIAGTRSHGRRAMVFPSRR